MAFKKASKTELRALAREILGSELEKFDDVVVNTTNVVSALERKIDHNKEMIDKALRNRIDMEKYAQLNLRIEKLSQKVDVLTRNMESHRKNMEERMKAATERAERQIHMVNKRAASIDQLTRIAVRQGKEVKADG